MGKKSQIRREKKTISEKERKEALSRIVVSKNPWAKFWKRFDFWIYILCFAALVAFPFIKKDAFGAGRAIIHTSMGDIEMTFYGESAPKTIDNFKKLAERNYYNDLTFHRVIKSFMIQAGDPKGDGTGGESADGLSTDSTGSPQASLEAGLSTSLEAGGTFADEINADSLGLDKEIVASTPSVYGQLSTSDKPKYAQMTVKAYYESKGYKYDTSVTSHKMVAGSVAMANRGPDTNGSQFFIVTDSPQPHLDGQHTVFAYVSRGMDIVKKISEVAVDSETDKPLDPVTMKSVQIIDSNN